MNRPLIFICSPYRGDVEANLKNACEYCRFTVRQGGIPSAPHLLFTRFLDDTNAVQRDAGIIMGIEMLTLCHELWAFGTPTSGMRLEISEAMRLGVPVRRFSADCVEARQDE